MSYNPAFGMSPAMTMNQYPGGQPPQPLPPAGGAPMVPPGGGQPPGMVPGMQPAPGMIPGLGPNTPAPGAGLPGDMDPASMDAMQAVARQPADQALIDQQLAKAKALRGYAQGTDKTPAAGAQAVTKTKFGDMVAPPNYAGAIAGALANYKAGQQEAAAGAGTEKIGGGLADWAKQSALEAGKKFGVGT